jgi:hypothetical protein
MQVVVKFSMELSIQISRFGGLDVFAQALVVTHLRIKAKESKKHIQGCSSNVG